MAIGEFGGAAALPATDSFIPSTPMYWLYELGHAALNPSRVAADATKLFKHMKVDIKAKLLIVMPKQGAVMSPRSLWEAVDKAGYEPTKLEGPGGSFTTKPKT